MGIDPKNPSGSYYPSSPQSSPQSSSDSSSTFPNLLTSGGPTQPHDLISHEEGRHPLWLSNIILPDRATVFLGMIFAIVIYIFYTSDFRNTLENYFYDSRTKWMSTSPISNNVVVITIDDESIKALESDPLRLRTDNFQRPYLSLNNLTKAASILANSDASAIALLMPENAFPASDLDMMEIRDLVKFEPRIVIGTTGYNQVNPNLGALPSDLQEISDQIAGFETFRARPDAIVRSLPYSSYLGLTQTETLPVKIANITKNSFDAQTGSFYLKHFPPDHFPRFTILELIANPDTIMPKLNGKVVVVGYTVERSVGFQTTEPMMANTPLTGQLDHKDDRKFDRKSGGVATTWVMANAIENLLLNETISRASTVPTIVQTLAIVTICSISWGLGSLTASITTMVVWILLLVIHSFLYRWLNLSIPLADTFLATALVSVFAATRRMKIELMLMADKVATSNAKSEVAATQSQFLHGFAAWLKHMTESVVGLIRESAGSTSEDQETKIIYQHAFTASEDFREYLETIRQIPDLEAISKRRITKQDIELEDFIKTIFRRFDVKSKARSVEFLLDISENARTIKSNPQLLDAIIFNYVSNAFKYGPDQTKILVKVRKISTREICISVIDHGMGIPAHLHDRIFERFYRITDDRMYKTKGTGLGLYLCRFFAESLGGRVEVVSEVDLGSEFKVVLP